jgi:DNA-binding transcriptional ArsR family regulator
MDMDRTVIALSALAQETRLRVFRLLVEFSPHGLPATEIAERLGVAKNLMSAHLTTLSQAGLTTTRREGRHVYHALDIEATRDLIGTLVRDCCQGQAETCSLLLDQILPAPAALEDSTIQEPLNH